MNQSDLVKVIDLHGLTVEEAKRLLEREIKFLLPQYREICVIHGYRQGCRLQEFVRKTLKAPRLTRKIMTLNPGETILIIAPRQH